MRKTALLRTNAILMALIVGFAFACSKEKEENKPYVGKWQSNVYPSKNLEGNPIFEQMVFDFANTTFEDKIYQGATADAIQLAAGIKGSIEEKTTGNLSAVIKEISLQGGPYTSKETDSVTFIALFSASLGKKLHESFEASYSITGDSMVFVIPIKNPQGGDDINTPLRLGKVK